MVRLIGWRGLGITPHEELRVQAIVDRHLQRISHLVDDVIDTSIRVRSAHKGGNTHRYEISVSLITASGLFNSRAENWDIVDAVHKAFENIETQLEHRQHIRERLYVRADRHPEPLLRM